MGQFVPTQLPKSGWNFRKFEELHIGFDRQLTVLVGDNGYGKSAARLWQLSS